MMFKVGDTARVVSEFWRGKLVRVLEVYQDDEWDYLVQLVDDPGPNEYREASVKEAYLEPKQIDHAPCDECRGTGRNRYDEMCTYCDGNGVVSLD
jgi:hypothetical protein